MVESSPPQKDDEQHPLLKVETGGGDSGRPPAVVAPGWNVACTPKRSWTDRWPELVSAFWLSGMFLGIFCLIVWGLLGCGAIKRQHILMFNYNSSKPGSEVYYHHIVQRGGPLPFKQFSEYLSNMATLYSSLRFNVIFLMDDTVQSGYRGPRHRFFNRLIPYHSNIADYKFDETNQQELKDFHVKYQNVNVTIMPLSKFMAMTPLRYKWRTVPMAYLTFYARVFSVWQTGGIGIDLNFFSTQFNHRRLPDRRISAVLKQHNNGIKTEEYTNTLSKIEREEQNELLSLFYGIVHHILNETRAFFNRTLVYSDDSLEKNNSPSEPLIRTHRNKRELDTTEFKEIFNSTETTIAADEIKVINRTDVAVVDSVYKNVAFSATEAADNELDKTDTLSHQNKSELVHNKTSTFFKSWNQNVSDTPPFLMVYDFVLFSDNTLGPSYFIQSNSPEQQKGENTAASGNNVKKSSHILSVNLEGTFIAASQKQHPFLAHIISAGCQRMPPRFAIQNAIISQCSHMFRDDYYCSNIFLF